MSRLVSLVVSLALLAGLFGVHSKVLSHSIIKSIDLAGSTVAVIGDSYTTGGDEGGNGAANWTALTWRNLAGQGIALSEQVTAESGAGYCTRGNHGSVFEDLTTRGVRPDDALVVLYGSRNDEAVTPPRLSIAVYGTLALVHEIAPSAKLLVIGPPWPTADPPPAILAIRDVLAYQAKLAHATFVDPIAGGWLVGRPELIGSDGIHPTDAGHADMAARIAPLIAAQLLRRV